MMWLNGHVGLIQKIPFFLSLFSVLVVNTGNIYEDHIMNWNWNTLFMVMLSIGCQEVIYLVNILLIVIVIVVLQVNMLSSGIRESQWVSLGCCMRCGAFWSFYYLDSCYVRLDLYIVVYALLMLYLDFRHFILWMMWL